LPASVARALFVLALLASLGCPPAGTRGAVAARRERLMAQAGPVAADVQTDFDRAFEAFARSDWKAAEQAFAAFTARHADSGLAAEARYRRGVALNRMERYGEAREVLREFLEKHPTSPYGRQGSVELGLAETKLGNRRDAEQILRPVVGELSEEERQEVGPALEEAVRAGSATVEAARRAAKKLEDAREGEAHAAAVQEFVDLLDAQASALDLAALQEELREGEPGALVAAKVARFHRHLGDDGRAREAAQRALQLRDEGPAADAARQVLERLAVRDKVRPELVGVILPESGRFKAYGKAVRDGVELAVSTKDGVELKFVDSAGEPEAAVQAVEELAREGAIAILGPVGTAEAAPAALRAQDLGVPLLELSRAEGVTQLGSWVFRNSLTNSAQGRALARYAAKVLGARTAAILAPDIASGEELSSAFWEEMEADGGEVRGWETYAADQTTFAPPIKRLVARDNLDEREEFRAEAAKIRARGGSPYQVRKALDRLAGAQPPVVDFEVLLVPDYHRTVALLAPALAVEDVITVGCDEKELERIRKTTRRDELRTVTMLGGAGWNSPELVVKGGPYVRCSVFVDGFHADSAREPTRRFVEEFQEAYQRKPGLLEAQGYDSARMVREVLVRHKPRTREALRAALAGLRKFPGATGETTFTPEREADKPLFFLTVDRTGISELDVSISPWGVAAPGPAAPAPRASP